MNVDVVVNPLAVAMDVSIAQPPSVGVTVASTPTVDIYSGPPGPQGPPGITQPFRLGHTWGLVGDVSDLTTLPSIFIPFNGTQAAKLVGIRTKLASGTSVGVQVKRNGSNVGGVITVTTASTMTSLGNVAISADDELSMVLSAPVGTPTHLSATLVVEHTP
jgi:hypothetical protein